MALSPSEDLTALSLSELFKKGTRIVDDDFIISSMSTQEAFDNALAYFNQATMMM